MKVDIKQVMIFTDDMAYAHRDNHLYNYHQFLKDMDAVDAPRAMYRNAFLYKLLKENQTKMISGQVNQVLILPRYFDRLRRAEIKGVEAKVRGPRLLIDDMSLGIRHRKERILLIWLFNKFVECMLVENGHIESFGYHHENPRRFIDQVVAETEGSFIKILVSDQEIPCDEYYNLKEYGDMIIENFNSGVI